MFGATKKLQIWQDESFRLLMMNLTITIKEIGPDRGEERIVEVRHVATESHKRLTAGSATRILRREIPDLPPLVTASKSVETKGVFFAMHHATQSPKCSFHYTWRHYYLSEDSN
jgi:hypothetical protein